MNGGSSLLNVIFSFDCLEGWYDGGTSTGNVLGVDNGDIGIVENLGKQYTLFKISLPKKPKN